jgi:hypothetical protein
MNWRPTLTLKRKPVDGFLANMLDEGSDLDPHNPHKLVQPSKAVIPDLDRLEEILAVFRRYALSSKDLSPRLADQLANEASSLTRKVGNAASDNAIDRE